jgi:hypothetical protein
MIFMEIKDIYNTEDRSSTVSSSSTAPLSAMQVRDEVRKAIVHLKAKKITDWQILEVWSEITQDQGNYAAADTRFISCL